MKFYSKYDLPKSPGFSSSKPSLTVQSAALEADVNHIMSQYMKTGVISPDVISRRQAVFSDVGKFGDYGTLLDAVCAVQEEFDALKPEIRERFNNSPEELINWLQDSANYEEAIQYGLMSKGHPVADSVESSPISDEGVKDSSVDAKNDVEA